MINSQSLVVVIGHSVKSFLVANEASRKKLLFVFSRCSGELCFRSGLVSLRIRDPGPESHTSADSNPDSADALQSH
jgi:hypothetical protein